MCAMPCAPMGGHSGCCRHRRPRDSEPGRRLVQPGSRRSSIPAAGPATPVRGDRVNAACRGQRRGQPGRDSLARRAPSGRRFGARRCRGGQGRSAKVADDAAPPLRAADPSATVVTMQGRPIRPVDHLVTRRARSRREWERPCRSVNPDRLAQAITAPGAAGGARCPGSQPRPGGPAAHVGPSGSMSQPDGGRAPGSRSSSPHGDLSG